MAERHIPKCANIVNKPGGIKPSTIQQKYIGGTGAASKKMEAPKSVQSTAVKPTISNGVKPIISAKSSAATKKY